MTSKPAGFFKRLKNKLGKVISGVNKTVNKYVTKLKPAINMIPLVGSVIGEVGQRITNTGDQFGQMLQGKITKQQFGNHIVDTYKTGALVAPYRLLKTGIDAIKNRDPSIMTKEIDAQIDDAMDYLDAD